MRKDLGKPEPIIGGDAPSRAAAFIRLFVLGIAACFVLFLVMVAPSNGFLGALGGFLILSIGGLPIIGVFAGLCFCLSWFWQPKGWVSAALPAIVCAAIALNIGDLFNLVIRLH